MKWAISVSRAGPLYRAGSAQALFPHKVVAVFVWEAEAEASRGREPGCSSRDIGKRVSPPSRVNTKFTNTFVLS